MRVLLTHFLLTDVLVEVAHRVTAPHAVASAPVDCRASRAESGRTSGLPARGRQPFPRESPRRGVRVERLKLTQVIVHGFRGGDKTSLARPWPTANAQNNALSNPGAICQTPVFCRR